MSTCLLHLTLLPWLVPGPLPNKAAARNQTKPSSPSLCLCRVTFLCHLPRMPPLCCCNPGGDGRGGRARPPRASPRRCGRGPAMAGGVGGRPAPVSRASGANGCLRRRNELLRPGKCSWAAATLLTSAVIPPGREKVLGQEWVGKGAQNWLGGDPCQKVCDLGQAASSPRASVFLAVRRRF